MTSSPDSRDKSAASASMGDAESLPSTVRRTTFYAVLNVSHDATAEEITTAYRRLALVYHPDRPNGSQAKFQEVQRAYEVLNTKETRAAYDAFLEGRVNLRKFKRPPPLESVVQPVYALLADGAFYEFEAASSKLKCSFHYGDGIQFNGDFGSFIGLAGDGFMYWTISGRGFASRLCKLDSSFALSSIRIMYRSNMGLRKPPLQRSFLKFPSTRCPAGPSGGTPAARHSGGGTWNRGRGRGTAAESAANMSVASRIKEALLSKERSRYIKKRLDTILQEETVERSGIQQDLLEQLSLLHTEAKRTFQSLLQGAAALTGTGSCVGHSFPIAPLCSSDTCGSRSTADPSSLQAASLWVDPPPKQHYTGDKILRENGDGSREDNRHRTSSGGGVASCGKPDSGQSSSTSSPSLRPIPASETAAGEDLRHGRVNEAPQTLLPTPPRFYSGAAAIHGASAGTGAEETKEAGLPSPSPSPAPVRPKPRDPSGKDSGVYPTTESNTFSTLPPFHAADVEIARVAAEEVVLGSGFECMQPGASGPCTRAEWGDSASYSLDVSSSVMEKIAEAVMKGEEGFTSCDSAAVLPPQHANPENERSLAADSKAATLSGALGPHGVPLTEAVTGRFSEVRKACAQLPSQSSNSSSVGVEMLRVGSGSAFGEKPELDEEGGHAALRRGTHFPKKPKARMKPRYMLPTEAYTRRKSLLLTDSFNGTTHSTSSLNEASHTYSSMTADQLFEEERLFMDSFSKTMRHY
ncbi:hypothetical protein LSCM1_03796 [Leishmania martiniquensis]|uniref:J domain-containing protein n=1 Tax=Leishmania martiniquensis TaxID=1580590 RepID=A0A836GR16_9TRYP|nr:hypothetical protein LSCM1_03796 [Leishmania martiniquensis]